jgi:putative acyl-CoA dehydrogenase
MLNVLADLALESEAATVLGLRLAAAVDHNESALSRLGTALGKYWVCKRGPVFVGEALECLGGNGYVEESVLPRLYREAPLNSIWEGPGNIQVLDILRILSRDATPAQALLEEVRTARGADRRLDAAVQAVEADLRQPRETDARRLAERLALLLQASLLVRWAPAEVAGVFCATRLDRQGGYAFGTLPAHAPARAIVQRAWPALT